MNTTDLRVPFCLIFIKISIISSFFSSSQLVLDSSTLSLVLSYKDFKVLI